MEWILADQYKPNFDDCPWIAIRLQPDIHEFYVTSLFNKHVNHRPECTKIHSPENKHLLRVSSCISHHDVIDMDLIASWLPLHLLTQQPLDTWQRCVFQIFCPVCEIKKKGTSSVVLFIERQV